MSPGALIRRAFGRHEKRVSELWRALFFDLAEWTGIVHGWAPEAKRILEVGCGEGYSTQHLVTAFPDAQVDAIDIAPNIGRLYGGPAGRANFRIVSAEDLAGEEPGVYDLIVLADVFHHVPREARESLLRAIAALLAPGGVFAFKDWHRNAAPIYYAAYASDRWLTGDRIAYLTPAEARAALRPVFGEGAIRGECVIRPWRNNYAICVVPR